jgi:protein-S-isoprenylcysteine O-methyltransferase
MIQGSVSKRTDVVLIKGYDPKSRGIFIFISLGFLCCAEPTLRYHNSFSHAPVRSLGIILVVLGFILSIESQKALGVNWLGTVGIRSHHRLVSRGPYRFVRHPMYTGITISQIGIGLFSMNLWMIFACFFFTLSFMVRVPKEEQLLSEYFKEEFVLYQEETGMFIPRLLRHR